MTSSSSKRVRLCWAAVLAAVLLMASSLLLAISPSRVGGQEVLFGSNEQALLELINVYRGDNGLAPLNFSPSLTDAALWMSQDMAQNDYFSHTDSLGRDPFQRMADFGYGYNTWKGENLAAGSDTPELTFQLWRESPGHNANMLNPNFVVAGIGLAYDSDPQDPHKWYWTLDVGGYDDSGSPPPIATPQPTPTSEPAPTSTPASMPTPEPAPTSTPASMPTPEPIPTSAPAPTPTPQPSPIATPVATPTPPEQASPPPTSEPKPSAVPSPELTQEAPPAPQPTLETNFPVPTDADLGLAPPTLDDEPAPTVRQLAPGWNTFECPPGSGQVGEVLPVDSGNLLAIYGWDAEEGAWRRYLPRVTIPGLNTLGELADHQTIWILASRRVFFPLPA